MQGLQPDNVVMLHIPPIRLEWSNWVTWDDLRVDEKSGGIRLPSKRPGVYEVKYRDAAELLTIGKTLDLRRRIRQGLVKGKTDHSAGTKIRAYEDTTLLLVRWATTDRPACAEEELHKQYRDRFGKLPRYVSHT